MSAGSSAPARSRILILSFSDLARDARLDRQIGFLREHYEVITAGLRPSVYPELEFIDLSPPAALRVKTGAGRRVRDILGRTLGRAHAVYWRDAVNARALEQLSGHGAELALANDLATLPLACEVADGRPVVLDAHEYAPAEQSQLLWWRLTMKPYIDALLRLYLPRISAMMTVSPGIARLYEATYGIPVTVLTNAPRGVSLEPARVGDPIRLVHHGIADRGRRIERMIEAMGVAGRGYTLDLMLVPADEGYPAELRELARRFSGVRMIEPCNSREIVARLNAYDVGVYLMPRRSLNQRLALPNKLFDFIQARLGLAIGPSPEMAALVSEWECGVIAESESVEAFGELIGALTPERVMELKWASHRAARELSAERNGSIVRELVDAALGASSMI